MCGGEEGEVWRGDCVRGWRMTGVCMSATAYAAIMTVEGGVCACMSVM